MSRAANTSVLVTSGDLALVTAGTAMFSCPVGLDGDAAINAIPGQLFAMDPNSHVAVDDSTVSASNIDRLIFGVAVDTNGDGLADTYRAVAGDELYGHYIDAIEAEAPVCGLPAIKDFLFKCTDVDSSYGVKIAVQNNTTRSYYPLNRGEEFVLTVDTDDPSCSTCSPTHDCKEVACKLVESFYMTGLDQYPDWKRSKRNFPVEVHRIFEQDYEFCLTPDNSACDDCVFFSALNRVRIGGAEGTVTVLTNTTNPADSSQTLIPQIKRIVDQANTLLGTLGHATFTQGTGGCCPIKLLVNTCLEFEIGYYDGETTTYLTPCNQNEDQTQPNPLDPIDNVDDCPNCGDSPTTTTYECGIRVIVRPELLNCNCQFPDLPPKAYFFGKVDIFPVDGWPTGSTTVVTKQEIQLPQNFGYWVKFLEYAQSTSGHGKGYLPFNHNRGQLGLPQGGGRVDAVTLADCKKDYCSYHIEHRIPWSDHGISGTFSSPSARTSVFVPNGDTTTKTSLEAFIAAWAALLPKNPTKVAVTCASDQEALGINGAIR